jgi:hypothetical protein
MGWWRIRNVESGQVDATHTCPTNPKFVNAVPGAETEENQLYNGDGPADTMGDAIQKIAKMYIDAWGRPPRVEELEAVFNFVFNPYRHGKPTDYQSPKYDVSDGEGI